MRLKLFIFFLFISYGLSAQQLKIGDIAPDFSITNTQGKTAKLSSLKGQVVLIDFWASWCKPCRYENPYLVAAYNEFKNERFKKGNGFTVMSISLDKSKPAWLNAIKKDGLVWSNHVSDLQGWKNKVALLYGVKSIPQSYLIDGEGKIISINPRGDKLEKELKKFRKKR